MTFQLGMHLTPSFAECCLIRAEDPPQKSSSKSQKSLKKSAEPEIVNFTRYYTPARGLHQVVKDFLEKSDVSPQQITQAFVASSFLEKILNSKIGGSVAQITTGGLEHWPRLRQNLANPFLEITPQRTDALALQDLLFPLQERVSAEGRIHVPLQEERLQQIMVELKQKKVQRVCVNLIFARANPQHQNRVIQALRENGFEVYCAESTDLVLDEVAIWRKNVLNASLAGTFDEVESQLNLEAQELKLEFLDVELRPLQGRKDHLCTSLFAPTQLLLNELGTTADVILNLGLENWSLLASNDKDIFWDSPWGVVAGPVPRQKILPVQPTQEFILDDSQGRLEFGSQALGFEPGPMRLGRALKPMLFDLLINLREQTDTSFVTPDWLKGEPEKFKQSLIAMMRTLKNSAGGGFKMPNSVEDLQKGLFNSVIDQIGLQTLMSRTHNRPRVVVTGFFAKQLLESLQKRWSEVDWILDPHFEERISLACASVRSASNVLIPQREV
jgi:hypothetical protein